MWLCLLFLPAESFFQVTAISVEHHSYQVQVQLYHAYDTRLLLSPSHGTAPNVIPGTSQYGVDAAAGHLLLAAVCVWSFTLSRQTVLSAGYLRRHSRLQLYRASSSPGFLMTLSRYKKFPGHQQTTAPAAVCGLWLFCCPPKSGPWLFNKKGAEAQYVGSSQKP